MIIAIDETGSFAATSMKRQFFVAVHIRQRKTLYKLKKQQFYDWEQALPRSLKNAKGEIKSNTLTDEQLNSFSKEIICSHPIVRITPLTINPKENPEFLMNKYKKATLFSIESGKNELSRMGNEKEAINSTVLFILMY